MSLATITNKLKLIPRDFGEQFSARVVGDGATSRYELPNDNIDATTLVVYIEGTPITTLTQGTVGALNPNEYSVDERAGAITLWAPLANGAVLVARGTSYLQFLPNDLTSWIDIAFQMHIRGRSPAPTYDNLPVVEEYLVAMLAAMEMLWSQAAEAANEIDILTPEGVNIPRSQRFAQIMALIQALDRHYKELAEALNVGPFAIRVLTLRRVSRTTGRLVPIYVNQEFDDRTYPPVRVLPGIDNGLV